MDGLWQYSHGYNRIFSAHLIFEFFKTFNQSEVGTILTSLAICCFQAFHDSAFGCKEYCQGQDGQAGGCVGGKAEPLLQKKIIKINM